MTATCHMSSKITGHEARWIHGMNVRFQKCAMKFHHFAEKHGSATGNNETPCLWYNVSIILYSMILRDEIQLISTDTIAISPKCLALSIFEKTKPCGEVLRDVFVVAVHIEEPLRANSNMGKTFRRCKRSKGNMMEHVPIDFWNDFSVILDISFTSFISLS